MDSLDLTTEAEVAEPIEEGSDSRYQVIGLLALLAVTALGVLFVLNDTLAGGDVVTRLDIQADQARADRRTHGNASGIPPSATVLSHLKIRDTVYTTDSVYLEVNLARQNVTVHNRNGGATTFLISSGNKNLKEGIATPTGLFTVQYKTPMALSKQFNNAKLHHWIGVQGGVGFHGLDGNGYYGNLGVRPSSHGCMRMSREEIARMYDMVHTGAMIMVDYGDPARVVAFCKPADTAGALLIDSASVYDRKLGNARLQALLAGEAWTNPQPRLVHLAGQRLRWGMEIGEGKRIPKQNIPERIAFSSTPAAISSLPADRIRNSYVAAGWNVARFSADTAAASRRNGEKQSEESPPVEFGE